MAADVGPNKQLTGQAIVTLAMLRQSPVEGPGTVNKSRNHVAKEIGAVSKPKIILIVAELPKTRSGKS
jgi:acetyl-CoA synthetase